MKQDYRKHIEVLERDLCALAAALAATPMPAIIDNDNPGGDEANLTLTWPKQRVLDWWATREPDLITARRILDSLKRQERIAGGREALAQRDSCRRCNGTNRITQPASTGWRAVECPDCGREAWGAKP